ncbi:hypothetical protein ACCO45_010942 [Purpureocillium lilacinum]|uniref:Uncharacterized protein n=1 Tax=Purpureocillium lilacinum TaxID=33203 RepID=A0ACC4DIK5_PURLI
MTPGWPDALPVVAPPELQRHFTADGSAEGRIGPPVTSNDAWMLPVMPALRSARSCSWSRQFRAGQQASRMFVCPALAAPLPVSRDPLHPLTPSSFSPASSPLREHLLLSPLPSPPPPSLVCAPVQLQSPQSPSPDFPGPRSVSGLLCLVTYYLYVSHARNPHLHFPSPSLSRVGKMAANKTSAVADEPVDVLFALHPKFDMLDFAGPLEVLTTACHDFKDQSSKAFEVTIAGSEPKVLSEQGVLVGSQISFKEAHDRLEEFDILVILGGNSQEVLDKEAEPLGLINDFAELQKKDPARERTVLSVCTGSLFLARENILSGLSATTHPDYMTKFEILCSEAATRNLTERTDVIEDARYVVNNLRFDLGDEDENPYIRRKSDAGRRPSNARAGVDAALYLVSVMVDEECAVEVARIMQWTWNKGVVVDGLDV